MSELMEIDGFGRDEDWLFITAPYLPHISCVEYDDRLAES